MSLYPSLEDLKADQLIRAQIEQINHNRPQIATAPPPYPNVSSKPIGMNEITHYPILADLNEYMGLNLTSDEVSHLTSRQVAISSPNTIGFTAVNDKQMVAPLSSGFPAVAKSQVTHGLREVILCKGKDGKVGLRVKALNKGIFIVLVSANSPAAMVGLRFGDQILQINEESVAGFSMEKVHDIFRKAPLNNIRLIIRDRPFERNVVLHKDSTGHIGFAFKNGKITAIVKDSSAARNGLLIDHNLLEINGQNVIQLGDKEIRSIIENTGNVISLTIMPSYLYEHMMKQMATSLVKKLMDHSIPEF